MKTVTVKASSTYNVNIAKGLLSATGPMIAEASMGCIAAIITDSTVKGLYLDTVSESLKAAGITPHCFSFPAGETSKNMSTLSDILEFMASVPLTRRDIVIALGGGVVGDISGFAAACYMRGIKYYQIPTTLLAAVDSSVGGKTAVDLAAGKNLAGAFIQPQAVFCDVNCFDTLSDSVFADGVAEAIKTGILFDKELFEIFESGNVKEDIEKIVSRCVMHKGRVVENDEFERGERKLLNLGHTVGHGIEKCSNYGIRHGNAVAVGTAMIARACSKLGYCEESVCKRIISTLERNGLPVRCEIPSDKLYAAMLNDKKRSGNKITAVLINGIGKCELREIETPYLLNILKAAEE